MEKEKYHIESKTTSSPAIAEGKLFLGSDEKGLFALDLYEEVR